MEAAEYEIMYRVEETHWWYRALHRLIFEALDRHLPDWRGKRILDAGCGTGAILQRLGQSERNVGIDSAPEAIHFCRQRGLTNAQQGDLNALPFADVTFDAAICASVLCHQSINPDTALSELHRVLRPHGLLFAVMPAYSFLHSAHDVAVMTARRFTKGQVREFLQRNRYAVRELTYWTTLLFPFAVAARTLRLSRSGRDFDRTGLSNDLLAQIMDFEAALRRRLSMPFGVALFAVAKKI